MVYVLGECMMMMIMDLWLIIGYTGDVLDNVGIMTQRFKEI